MLIEHSCAFLDAQNFWSAPDFLGAQIMPCEKEANSSSPNFDVIGTLTKIYTDFQTLLWKSVTFYLSIVYSGLSNIYDRTLCKSS